MSELEDKKFKSPYEESNAVDNERLALMADLLDKRTLAELADLDVNVDSLVLDVGAGHVPNLGHELGRQGVPYLALDFDRQAVAKQIEHGNLAIECSATDIDLESSAVSHINERFMLAWVPNERDQVWDEFLRVGRTNLQGLATEYDWNGVAGPPVFMQLATGLKQVLAASGFDHGYGARLHEDVRAALTMRVGSGNFYTVETRKPLPAESPNKRLEVIVATSESVINNLRKKAADPTTSPEQTAMLNSHANALQSMLNAVQAADIDPAEITFPDVVSVKFGIRQQPWQVGSAALAGFELAVPDAIQPPDARIVYAANGWDVTLTGNLARRLFKVAYRAAGYTNPKGLSPAEFDEAIDSEETRCRSELVVVLGPNGKPISTVRLQKENARGITSLPVPRMAIADYGEQIIPAELRSGKSGEITNLASNHTLDPIFTVSAILTGIKLAREAGLERVYYGAVVGGHDIDSYLHRAFHDIMQPLRHPDGHPVTVTVRGPGYREEGIQLAAGYSNTDDFFDRMIEYNHNLDTDHARYIIRLCEELRR